MLFPTRIVCLLLLNIRCSKYEALIGHGLMNFLIKLHSASTAATRTESQSNNIIESTKDLKFPRSCPILI